MRLTLRTMLAYLDDLLDPSNAQDLGRKIEESELATGLVARIRDVTRRMRLGAPKLTGRGMGLDPNTVAEYLDNTLTVARIPDFEKICLESDMHLAEVACSHQILALVLGGPADVNPASRQRMYKLISRPEEATIAIAPAAPEKPAPLYSARPKRKVPDYLREEPARFGGWAKAAAAILVLAGLAGTVWMAVGPFNRSTQVVQAPDESPAGKAPIAVQSTTGGAAPGNAELPAESAEVAAERNVNNAIKAGGSHTARGAEQGDSSADETTPIEEADAESSDSSTGESSVEEDRKRATDDAGGEAEEAAGTEGTPEAAAPGAGEVVARYDSEKSVLLQWRGDKDGWMRVPNQANLSVEAQLLSPPLFRSAITFNAGVSMELVGETLVQFLSSAAVDVPSIEISYGRLVLMTAGRPGAQISITAGQLKGTLMLAEAASVVGVEFRPIRIEGTDPEIEAPAYQFDLYIGSGELMWMDSSQAAPEKFVGPQHWSWPVAVTEETANQIPSWVLEADTVDPTDRKAADFIADNLALDRSAQLELKRLSEHRRPENGSVAITTLAAMGNYDAAVKALRDENQRAHWKAQVDELRAAIALGPESAARVRAAIDRQVGARGAQLYRMLWGYSEAELKSGAAAELVEFLNDDKYLDVRVVSHCTLERVAGMGYSYRASDNPASRQGSLQRWRQWAKAYQSTLPAAGRSPLP